MYSWLKYLSPFVMGPEIHVRPPGFTSVSYSILTTHTWNRDSENVDYIHHILRYDGRSITTFRRNILGSTTKRKKRAVIRRSFVVCFVFVSSLHYSSSLKLQAVSSSETSVNFYRIMRPHTTEDSTFQGNYTLYQYFWLGNMEWFQNL